MKTSFADILDSMEAGVSRKLARKLPGWSGRDVVIPDSLALEQCSSSVTAAYKLELLKSRYGAGLDSVCDITGGLGADAFVLAGIAGRYHFYERKTPLIEAARHNAAVFGLDNIEFHNEEVGPQTLLPKCSLIYADPARRDRTGRKIFALSDCSPDISALLPMLLGSSERLMLKLSPMADISSTASQLGPELREVHIVSAGGEVKELLCLIEGPGNPCGDGTAEEYRIIVAECGREPGMPVQEFSFLPSEEAGAEIRLSGEISPGMTLLEPSAGMLKSGAFKLMCRRFGLTKAAVSTHLYLAPGSATLTAIPERLFKRFRIMETLPYSKAGVRYVGENWPEAEVSTRNMLPDSEVLKRMTGCHGGGKVHVFGCTLARGGKTLIITERL